MHSLFKLAPTMLLLMYVSNYCSSSRAVAQWLELQPRLREPRLEPCDVMSGLGLVLSLCIGALHEYLATNSGGYQCTNSLCINDSIIYSRNNICNWQHSTWGIMPDIYQRTRYLAINSGGCLCTNSLCSLTTAWLDASREAEIMFDRYVRE